MAEGLAGHRAVHRVRREAEVVEGEDPQSAELQRLEGTVLVPVRVVVGSQGVSAGRPLGAGLRHCRLLKEGASIRPSWSLLSISKSKPTCFRIRGMHEVGYLRYSSLFLNSQAAIL